jgi:hypothetical protein
MVNAPEELPSGALLFWGHGWYACLARDAESVTRAS